VSIKTHSWALKAEAFISEHILMSGKQLKVSLEQKSLEEFQVKPKNLAADEKP
jgi:hypothetical protein